VRLRYVDSSALVKLLIKEPESTALRRYIKSARALATSRIALVEVMHAVSRSDPSTELQEAAAALLESCTLLDVGRTIISAAATLSGHGLRSLDAIHLATALRLEVDELIAYDRRLIAAAADAGLAVASPGA
jgi:hypothetical protein